MAIDRRRLLGFTASGLLLGTIPALVSAMTASHLRVYKISDDLALPMFRAGDILVVDSAGSTFNGAGVYLYPAWGAPRPYLVMSSPGGMLAFCNPATGKVLWTQSRALDPVFAGRVVGQAGSSSIHASMLSTLQLPALPARPFSATA